MWLGKYQFFANSEAKPAGSIMNRSDSSRIPLISLLNNKMTTKAKTKMGKKEKKTKCRSYILYMYQQNMLIDMSTQTMIRTKVNSLRTA